MEEWIERTERFVRQEHPDASIVILAGSAVLGQWTPKSDFDVLVVDPTVQDSVRYIKMNDGYPFEVFLIAERHVSYFIQAAKTSRLPSFLRMCLMGTVIKGDENANSMVKCAQQAFQDGPNPVSFVELDRLRYEITQLVEDLDAATNQAETIMIVSKLVDECTAFIFGVNGHWRGEGKWAYRELKQLDESMADRFMEAVHHVWRTGEKKPLIHWIEELLIPYGGKFKEGLIDGFSWPEE